MNRHTQALLDYKARLFSRLELRNPDLASQLRNMKLDWYRVQNVATEDGQPDPETTDILIYDEIGGSFGVDASLFVEELGALTSKNINIRINSPGGSLFDSIAIHNAILKKREEAKVITYVDALAASGASLIAMAGQEVVMMPGSQLMIHDALGQEIGNEKDHRIIADFLGMQSGNIADMYAAKAGGTRDEWRERMQAETWMFADEAIKLGLADRQYIPPVEDEDEEEVTTADSNANALNGTSLDIAALMKHQHTLSNRGFKYQGRNAAPAPAPLPEAHTDALANAFSILNRKVR